MDEISEYELAAYIPYGITIEGNRTKNRYVLKGLIGTAVYVEGISYACGDINDFTLVLRPSKAVFDDYDAYYSHYAINTILGNGNTYGRVTIENTTGELEFKVFYSEDAMCDSISFELIEEARKLLLGAHIDIFNLIPRGLAIEK